MPTGALTPDARLRILSDLAAVVPGAKLNTYVAGSLVTRLNTYSDSALTTPNANPVVASAGGLFGPIYLTPGSAYQFQLTDTAGVVIWTQDNVGVDLYVSAAVTAAIAAALVPVVQTTTVTGAQNNFALTANCALLRVNNAALVTFSGFSAGYDGQRLTVESIGAGQVDFIPQSALSTVGNRFVNFATIGNTSHAPGSGRSVYVYDLTTARWVLIHHEQGAWIAPAYAAGDFTASSGTWTVDAGDVGHYRYRLSGRTLEISWYLNTTSVSATPTTLKIRLPGGFTGLVGPRAIGTLNVSDNGATFVQSNSEVPSGGTTIDLYKTPNAGGGGTFAVAVNTTYVSGSIRPEVQ